MNFDQILPYLIPALFVAMIVWQSVKYRKVRKMMPDLIKQGAILVDVRSKEEFQAANNPKCLNIPLDEFNTGYKKLSPEKLIVLCCRSGNRSGMAANLLRRNGYKQVINAGPWTNTIIAPK